MEELPLFQGKRKEVVVDHTPLHSPNNGLANSELSWSAEKLSGQERSVLQKAPEARTATCLAITGKRSHHCWGHSNKTFGLLVHSTKIKYEKAFKKWRLSFTTEATFWFSRKKQSHRYADGNTLLPGLLLLRISDSDHWYSSLVSQRSSSVL